MKKIKLFLKWFLGIAGLLLVIFLVIALWFIKSEEKQLSGENTIVVDASQFQYQHGKLAVTNVGVLSTNFDSILPNRTVLINDKIIEYVGEGKEVPTDYMLIDGQGKFLIPGLVDTHIHPYRSPNDLLLYLANGITQVAIMNSWDGLYLQWREEAKKGALMPQMYIAAGPMSSAHDFRSKAYGVLGPIPVFNDSEQTKKAVGKFKRMGYDALKAYSLDRDNYFAVSEEAKKQNISMVGHVTSAVSLNDLYNSNQSQIAHVEEITKALEREFGGLSKIYYENTEAFLSFVNENADHIAKRLKEKNVTVSTTIDVYPRAKQQDLDLEAYLKSIKIEYLNPGILEGSLFNPSWLPGGNKYENPNNVTPEKIERAKVFWDVKIEAINAMTIALVSNGVTVTVGTDAGNPGILPGFSMHDELEQLSTIGMSNQEVLKAATKAGAEWMGSSAGVIEVGRRADLVLLDKNPLENIKNTRSIHGLITNGKYLNRNQLDDMLQSVKAANNQSRKVNINKYLGN